MSKLPVFSAREREVLSAEFPAFGLPVLKPDTADVHNISLYERAFVLKYEFTEEDLRRLAGEAVDDMK